MYRYFLRLESTLSVTCNVWEKKRQISFPCFTCNCVYLTGSLTKGEIQCITWLEIASGCHDFHCRMRFLTLDIARSVKYIIYIYAICFHMAYAGTRKHWNNSNVIDGIDQTIVYCSQNYKKPIALLMPKLFPCDKKYLTTSGTPT